MPVHLPRLQPTAFEIIESYTASPGAKKRMSSRVAAVLRSKEPRSFPSLRRIAVLLYRSQSGGIKRDCFAAFTLKVLSLNSMRPVLVGFSGDRPACLPQPIIAVANRLSSSDAYMLRTLSMP